MRDVYELAQRMDDKMDSWFKGCSKCKEGLQEDIIVLKQDVQALKDSKTECRANRRSWRDYSVPAVLYAVTALTIVVLDHFLGGK